MIFSYHWFLGSSAWFSRKKTKGGHPLPERFLLLLIDSWQNLWVAWTPTWPPLYDLLFVTHEQLLALWSVYHFVVILDHFIQKPLSFQLCKHLPTLLFSFLFLLLHNHSEFLFLGFIKKLNLKKIKNKK